MSTIKVVNIQHPDSVDPNLVLQADGDTVFASGLTVSGTFDIANDLTVSGNTGLGTSSPTSKLHVVDTTTNLQLESTADSSSGKIDFIGKDASSNSYRTLTIDTNSTGQINIETDPDNGGYSTDKSIIFKQAGSEKARIDNSGNVGIGTNSPSAKLEVSRLGSAWTGNSPAIGTGLFIHNGNNVTTSPVHLTLGAGSVADSSIFFADELNNDIGAITYRHNEDTMAFDVGNTERMRVNANGNIGIGTSNPEGRLHIRSDGDELRALLNLQNRDTGSNAGSQINFFNGGVDLSDNRLAYIRSLKSGSNGNFLTFGTNPDGNAPSERMRIDANGNITINNDLAVNTDTLYVDTTNDRVGIGTASPSEALDIQGGLIINGGNITSIVSSSISDDSFYNLDVSAAGFMLGGVAVISVFSTYDNFPQPVGTGIFYYDCGNSLSGARILADADPAFPLTGGTTSTSTTITDFADNRITIICNSSTLRIANRIGGNRAFKLTFL